MHVGLRICSRVAGQLEGYREAACRLLSVSLFTICLESLSEVSVSMKYFEHPELQSFKKELLQPSFRYISNVKPNSSRSESSEAYWVCSGYQGKV